MFPLEMFDQLFELSLRSIDLLLKQVGPFRKSPLMSRMDYSP
jgi:hypothetical protein